MPKINIYYIPQENQLKISHSGTFHFPEMVLILGNTLLYYTNEFLKSAPEDKKEEIKAQMYDELNYRFTGILETFAPEYELRPGLTEEALMQAENETLLSKMQE